MPDRADLNETLAALRLSGAQVFDPVGLHYLQSLADRMQPHQGEARQRLARSFDDAHKSLSNRLAQAQAAKPDARTAAAPANKAKSPLGMLLEEMGVQHNTSQVTGDQNQLASPQELKAIQQYRGTWSKLSVDHQVAQAIAQAPENAGPLNSHMLVLRSLTQMREISPAYLNRFMSYIDTLMCLEQANKKPRQTGASNQTKSSRSRTRKGGNTK